MKKGLFIVIDGIDGVGKGVFLDAFVQAAREDGQRIFDVNEYWHTHGKHPDPQEIISNFDVAITSEPTFVGIGKHVREELIKKGHSYSQQVVGQGYALDRHILYEQLLLPLLKAGITIFQSRSFSTSIVYQRQAALDEGASFGIEQIMEIPGNAFCAQYPMTHLIVPTIKDVQEAINRAQSRDKDDNCEFENLDFQLKIKEHYESKEFKDFFSNLGVPLTYFDAGQTLEFSRQQAIDFYNIHIK